MLNTLYDLAIGAHYLLFGLSSLTEYIAMPRHGGIGLAVSCEENRRKEDCGVL